MVTSSWQPLTFNVAPKLVLVPYRFHVILIYCYQFCSYVPETMITTVYCYVRYYQLLGVVKQYIPEILVNIMVTVLMTIKNCVVEVYCTVQKTHKRMYIHVFPHQKHCSSS